MSDVGDRGRRTLRIRVQDGDPVAHRHGPPGRASVRADRRRGCRSSPADRSGGASRRAGDGRRRSRPACGTCTGSSGDGRRRRSADLSAAYAATRSGSARRASRNARSRMTSSPRGWTCRWIRNRVPSTTIEPTSIGRVGGNGSWPGCGPNPRSNSISATTGMSSGSVAMTEVHDALAGQAGHGRAADVLDHEVRPRSATSAITVSATVVVRGSHGRTLAGRRSYGPIGCPGGHVRRV